MRTRWSGCGSCSRDWCGRRWPGQGSDPVPPLQEGGWGCLTILELRQVEQEGRPGLRGRLEPEPPSVLFHDRLGNAQAEPGSSPLPRGGDVALGELLDDVGRG